MFPTVHKNSLKTKQIKKRHFFLYVKTHFLDYNFTKLLYQALHTVVSAFHYCFLSLLFHKTIIIPQFLKLISGCCECAVKKQKTTRNRQRKKLNFPQHSAQKAALSYFHVLQVQPRKTQTCRFEKDSIVTSNSC